ncbi:MAG: DUF2752 domain-containing protein [Verrucomicrobia bacterium]|nr:DUF2752 domain-containing protein [Verrucomicrobiota bacterium]
MELPPATESKIRLKGWYFLAVAIVLAAILVLFFFNPAQSGFYPRCLLKASTGLDCPGCGALRGMHQLLHGNVGTAFSLNPLLVILLPVAGLLLLNQLVRRARGRPLFQLKLPAYLMWVLLAVVVVFTVLRNLSATPFS